MLILCSIFLTLFISQLIAFESVKSQKPSEIDFEPEVFITNIGDLEVYEGIAFVNGMYVPVETKLYDVSKPQWPKTILNNPYENDCHLFAFDNDLIYSINSGCSYHRTTTLSIHQITENKEFKLVGELLTDYESDSIAVSGDRVYLLEYYDYNYTIGVYDISNPSDIIRVGQSQNLSLSILELNVYKDLAFIKHNGFEIYNVSDSNAIVKISTINNTGIYDYFIENDFMYCVANQSKIAIFDVSDFTNPILVSTYDAGESVRKIVKNDNILYAKLYTDLLILDLDDNSNPQFVTLFALDSWSNNLIYYDGYLFSDDVLDLQVIDVSDLSNLKILINVPRLLGYILTSVIVLLSLISIIFISIRYRKDRKLEMKLEDEIQENIVKEDAEEKKDNLTIFNLEKALKITAIIFVIQNFIMMLQIVMIILIEFAYIQSVEIAFNIVLAIPLVLDLLCGLTFAIILLMIYLKKKKLNYLLSSISWIGWIGFAITYRIMFGFPNLYSILSFSTGINPYFGAIFLAASLFCFWAAIFLFNYDNKDPIMKNYGVWFAFGNWTIGILLTYALMILMESVGPEALFYGLIGGFIYILKIAFIPIIGAFYFLDLRRKINHKHSTLK